MEGFSTMRGKLLEVEPLEERKMLAGDIMGFSSMATTFFSSVSDGNTGASSLSHMSFESQTQGEQVLERHLAHYGDAGEPDPAQTDGADGRVYDPIAPQLAEDTYYGTEGEDTFEFRPILNAKAEIIAKHTDANGVTDWTGNGVAGENNNVHDHWVEGIGQDTIRDFGPEDNIYIDGHTVSLDSIEYGTDFMGDEYSLITISSDQGGAGAHDGDPLGKLLVYGTKVEEGVNLTVVDNNNFYSIDDLYAEGEHELIAESVVPKKTATELSFQNSEVDTNGVARDFGFSQTATAVGDFTLPSTIGFSYQSEFVGGGLTALTFASSGDIGGENGGPMLSFQTASNAFISNFQFYAL